MALIVMDMKTQSHCPLVLRYKSETGDRSWLLSFQLHPKSEITLEGDQPTKAEIKECLSGFDVPSWLVDVCLVASEIVKVNL